MSLKEESSNNAFGGTLKKYSFTSSALGGLEAKINVFLPEAASSSSTVPAVYYLAGLTCSEDTGAQKGGFLRDAAKEGIALVFPDTSPRGAAVEGEDDDGDFGTGASFYLTSTQEKYRKNYNMYQHIVEEIPQMLKKSGIPIDGERVSLMGHSMGGHGALSLYLKNPGKYRSASGLAPICNPTNCQWGKKAFSGYLSSPEKESSLYDSTLLLASFPKSEALAIRIDYGTGDQFLKQGQLRPEAFEEELKKLGRQSEVEMGKQEGYDHSYYFVSTFAPEHIAFHAKHLKA